MVCKCLRYFPPQISSIQHYDDYDGPLISIDTAVLGVKKTGRMVT